jgi:hypothetical protein
MFPEAPANPELYATIQRHDRILPACVPVLCEEPAPGSCKIHDREWYHPVTVLPGHISQQIGLYL